MTAVMLSDGTGAVLVRVSSHRASDKLSRLLGPLEWWFTFEDGNNMAGVPQSRLGEARAITGVTLARPKAKPMRCWA